MGMQTCAPQQVPALGRPRTRFNVLKFVKTFKEGPLMLLFCTGLYQLCFWSYG